MQRSHQQSMVTQLTKCHTMPQLEHAHALISILSRSENIKPITSVRVISILADHPTIDMTPQHHAGNTMLRLLTSCRSCTCSGLVRALGSKGPSSRSATAHSRAQAPARPPPLRTGQACSRLKCPPRSRAARAGSTPCLSSRGSGTRCSEADLAACGKHHPLVRLSLGLSGLCALGSGDGMQTQLSCLADSCSSHACRVLSTEQRCDCRRGDCAQA